MVDATLIKEHMEIVGADGVHVGTVDHLDGTDRIKLTQKDPASGGRHHWLHLDQVESVSDVVKLRVPANNAKAGWQTS